MPYRDPDRQREYVQRWRESHPESQEWLRNKPLRQAARRSARTLARTLITRAIRPLLESPPPALLEPALHEVYRQELERLAYRIGCYEAEGEKTAISPENIGQPSD
jgi:hypothetical protein